MITTQPIVLFDAFETLGCEVAGKCAQRCEAFEPYASALALLEQLGGHARIGVFSLDPEVPLERFRELLTSGPLRPFVDPELVGVARRDDPDPFTSFLSVLDVSPERTVFVSLDARQRAQARAAGLWVAPHPALAAPVLAGESLYLVRLVGPEDTDWAALLEGVDAVPILATDETKPVLYAIAAGRALEALRAPSVPLLEVGALAGPDVVSDTTFVLLQVVPEQVIADEELQAFLGRLDRTLPLVRGTPKGYLVAFPSDRSPEELHPPPVGAGHGHTRILLPDSSVIRVRRRSHEPLAGRGPSDDERRILDRLTGATLRRRVRGLLGEDAPGVESPDEATPRGPRGSTS